MGAWGYGILDNDISMDWYDRWVRLYKDFKDPDVVSLIVKDTEDTSFDDMDKAYGYMVLGVIILANNLPINARLKSKILTATTFEKSILEWDDSEERERVLVDFREKISLLNNS